MKNTHFFKLLCISSFLFFATTTFAYFEWVSVSVDSTDPEKVLLSAKAINFNSSVDAPTEITCRLSSTAEFEPRGKTVYENFLSILVPELAPGEEIIIDTFFFMPRGENDYRFIVQGQIPSHPQIIDWEVINIPGDPNLEPEVALLTEGEGRKIRQRNDGSYDLLIFDAPNWKIMVLDVDCEIKYTKILGEGDPEFDLSEGFLLATSIDSGKVVRVNKFDARGNLVKELSHQIPDGRVGDHPKIIPHSSGGFYLCSNFGYELSLIHI